ncbi:MAG: hypothetical protein HN704_04590 [Bacteroidetes bacterium]|jgi:hypothetical protein|nr:hypothetical protein [Bacteroidota bacterium]MBT6685989.1 hypothetical protein [Bacteroidota bacterium]MBT7144411.1 hypothetical protein [Bacteroidota bacterium]MBT7490870.1 hypothetical protein [Bacteroidota bacterium]
MAEFNFKQAVYAGMIAIAGVDDDVSKNEIKNVDRVFKLDYNLTKKEKKEVLELWESNKGNFTQIVIDELKTFSEQDQKDAFTRAKRFINFTKNQYNRSKEAVEKGIDPKREEIYQYLERAEEIKVGLGLI